MRTWRNRLVAAGLILAAGWVVGQQVAHAAPATMAAPSARVMSPATDAMAASTDAKDLRREVAGLLQQYINEYGSRFTPAELQQLQDYRANADRQLAAVVLVTNRVKYLASKKASSAQIASAVGRATTIWKRAKSTAETTWEDARRVMEPKLSLFEKVGAANDYNAMMDRFDALGDRIKGIR